MTTDRKKATTDQKEFITAFIESNEGMKTRKFSGSMTYQKYQELWQQLADQLNVLGPVKSVKEWQKYWNDQRSRVKRKAAEIKESIRTTAEGGSDAEVESLSVADEKILGLIEGDNIQKEIAESLQRRNIIEQQKCVLMERKLAILVRRNKLEEVKINAINNFSNALTGLMSVISHTSAQNEM